MSQTDEPNKATTQSTEQDETVVNFDNVRKELENFDWYLILDDISSIMRCKLSRDEKIGKAISFAEGEKIVNSLSLEVLQSVRNRFNCSS